MAMNILTALGLPFLVDLVGGVLRGIMHPSAQSAADALDGLDKAIRQGSLSSAELTEANRHIEEMARLKSEEHIELAAAVNKSLRAEIKSDDQYVRRMRPTFGYIMALTWAAQMLSIAYIMVFRTAEAHIVINAVQSLSGIWAVALSVLGVYVYKRSEDKKIYLPRALPLGRAVDSVANEIRKSAAEQEPRLYNE